MHLKQFHFANALADVEADARRRGVCAIYLRCYAPTRAAWKH
ncbi:hypothetical protein KL86DES1_10815 [uncultured Desulfovibrio sp.]|uniref:Uncharacterized protein n=1 Tax=uncultured Desulfovibrio sp. TaxID=167968 RepID=A0A212L0I5_9BACT|nr:hypothetical protein KL86DES1_10815 [uncultured Desulfovibrio sp.]VZH32687.1 conserved protein of unknown function [Desulfovibrio sp. 86]